MPILSVLLLQKDEAVCEASERFNLNHANLCSLFNQAIFNCLFYNLSALVSIIGLLRP